MESIESITFKPRVLIMGPGGVRGLLMLGWLSKVKSEMDILRYIDTYCGVSVGAIISLLMCVGYKMDEIISEAITFDLFQDYTDLNMSRIITNKGILSNTNVRKTLTRLVTAKLGYVPTLLELYTDTGNSFCSVAYNISRDCSVFFQHETHPYMSCIDATIASMSLPLIYEAFSYNDELYVDGALGNSYPVDYFDDGETQILGLHIVNDNSDVTSEITGFNFLYRIIQAPMKSIMEMNISKSSDKCLNVGLTTKVKDTTGIALTTQDKKDMIDDGSTQGIKFINSFREILRKNANKKKDTKYKYPKYYS